jgi:hypothetical protein
MTPAKRTPSQRSGAKVRLKLVQVGAGRVLLVRLLGGEAKAQTALRTRLRTLVADEFLTFDGCIFRISHEMGIERVCKHLGERATPVYDPNLQRDLPALPCPWPTVPVEPVRTPETRPRIYMARVWHPEFAESLAFQLPSRTEDLVRDDVEIDFERELSTARRWRINRKDLDRVPVCVVADHYEPRVHDILDRHYDCCWDEFLAGDEWEVLPHPEPTQYPVRTLSEDDFRALEVVPYGDIDEINQAYREKKEDYLNLRIPAEEWLDVDVAYQRIRRYHIPRGADGPEVVVAPAEILARLRELLPERESDRVRWFHAFSWALAAIPADLVTSPEGCERLLRHLRSVDSLMPGAGFVADDNDVGPNG